MIQEDDVKHTKNNDKFMGTAKVGPKGQIVIPKEIRSMFSIEAGDTMIILADKSRGIAIERYSTFAGIADAIFDGKAKELYPEQSEENSDEFARTIKDIAPKSEEK